MKFQWLLLVFLLLILVPDGFGDKVVSPSLPLETYSRHIIFSGNKTVFPL